MEEFEDFNVIFGGDVDLTYDHKTIDKIAKTRRLMDNTLFFDRLLGALGISNAHHLYPPKSNEDLQTLYDSIVSASAQDHHKHSLVYYVLKDLKLKSRDSETFAKRVYLPERYKTFIDGIWYLDRLALEEALNFLTEPCLIPTFPEEILYALCRHCQHDHTIPLQYYHTVSPPISNPKVLEAYFQCVCKSSVTEALSFARTQSPLIHRRLFERMLAFVHGSSSGKVRSDRAMELVGLPFTGDEQLCFEQFLLEGKGKSLFGAKDTVIMRYMALGQSQQAQNVSREVKERRIDNMNWASLTQGSVDP